MRLAAHPGGAHGPRPVHPMIAAAEALPRRKSVRRAPCCSSTTSTPRRERGDQKVVGVERIGEQHIARLERREQRAREIQLAVPAPRCGAAGGREQRAARQIDHRAQTCERKADARRLARGLREGAWFSAVSGIEIPVPSSSFTVRPRQRQSRRARALKRAAALAGERLHHRQRQPRSGAAVPARADALRLQPFGRAARRPSALTARWHEPSAFSAWRRNIASVTVGGYSRSRCSGRCASVTSSSSGPVSTLKNSSALLGTRRAARSASTLPPRDLDVTMGQGWPRGWWNGCLVTNILSTSASLPLSLLNHLRLPRSALRLK